MTDRSNQLEIPDRTVSTLLEIVRQFGTPTYAFDMQRMRSQVEKLQSRLPTEVGLLFSLKANASLGICDLFQECGIGADVASAGEMATAIEAEFPAERIFVAGPFKLPETISQLQGVPQAVVSIDSPSEFRALSDIGLRNPVVLRLRPDFGSCAVVPAGCDSRFGFTSEDLAAYRKELAASELNVIGFHVFAGSQILDTEKAIDHLNRSVDLSLRAAEILGITATLINLGGGFGIPYGPADEELDLDAIGAELARLVDRAAPARFVLELGRFLVAEAGWYLTSVVGHHTGQGRRAVVVDGGVHQRADMCGLRLRTAANPPVVLDASAVVAAPPVVAGSPDQATAPTDVWGCLSLPDDILAESCPLPSLSVGSVLAFANAGAYGIWSSPALFHGSPLPAEVAFEGSTLHVMRERKPAQSILDDQQHLIHKNVAAHS
jgi:diaminopimelate decarboxylase